MAETISLEALERFLQTTKDASLQAFVDAMKAGNQTMADMNDIAARVGPQIAGALQSANTSANTLGNTLQNLVQNGSNLFSQLADSIQSYVKSQEDSGESIETLAVKSAVALEHFINIIPDAVTGMGSFGEAGVIAGTKISEAFGTISPILTGISFGQKWIVDGMSGIAQGADRAYQLQHGLISLAASQGQLNSVIDYGTNSFSNIDESMSQMADSAFYSAQATGQSVGAMMNLAEKLGTIPGALSDGINVAGQFSSQLTVTSQIAAAFGQSQTEVAKTLTTMYDQMGLHGTESMQVISRMYEAAGDSKLRFEGFSKSVMDIASSFKMLGDNTNAATTIVKAFDTAFKDSEISPAAIQQVVTSLASGIKEMDIGRKAFVSGATGGPGGLAGAFQIELALQEGRMDEVLSKTMEAMQSQFGSQVLTLKDAAENPALSGEFLKQREFTKMFTGVKSDAEANRMLEAMQGGVLDNIKLGGADVEADKSQALLTATNRGFSEQQRTANAAVAIQQHMERGRLMQSGQDARINTFIAEKANMSQYMNDAIGQTGASGVQSLGTTSAFRDAIVPITDQDRMIDMANGVRETIRIGSSMIESYKSRNRSDEEEDLTSTQVGAGINMPRIARAPAGPNAIMGTPVGGSGGGGTGRSPLDVFQETGKFPVTVEHSPIEVKVDLGEPFNKAVTAIVRKEIQESNAAQNIRANGGT